VILQCAFQERSNFETTREAHKSTKWAEYNLKKIAFQIRSAMLAP